MDQNGTLYIVATPIGNLSDITAHAIDCLKTVAIIACEDTRTSGKLLNHFNIPTKTWAYHDHNAEVQTPKLIEVLQSGQSIALISDAGTPLISDPGFRLVRACHQAGIKVSPVVGASAAIAALSVAGLPSDKFYFYGFLPAKTTGRQSELAKIKDLTATLIFYEAPHRIVECIDDMITVLGDNRQVTFCRELTKTFETIYPSTLGELKAFVASDANQQKGEMVLVVAGANDSVNDEGKHDALLKRLLQDLSVKKAAQLASDITGTKKNALYERALMLKDDND
ncbi:16S rRNA (cytidine(1402)-2'-O)-methyltransferase [Moraxella osloensis]|nr:16S rRNA (cytidine(1402)-2'-O)-methyltransferase [Moraxella osloensis]MBW4015811.1 16S rRNA (cytidine(1402)-2'-O)-methyltransferase [Moraxella osloensis]